MSESGDFLFSASEARTVRALPTLIPACNRCGLSVGGCQSPKMKVDGEGKRKILFCSDYNGKTEDAKGRPMVGKAGELLDGVLSELGVRLRRDCWVTNAIICYHPSVADHKTAVTDCRPNLLRTIRELDPEVIILAGAQAVRSLIGHLWKEKTGPIGRWVGWTIPAHKPNCYVCPTYNPAHLLYDDADPVLRIDFRRHLEAAFALSGRPWTEPPDYGARVEIVTDPDEAAARIDTYDRGIFAFDFETNCLKPDGRRSEIVSCAVCYNGLVTISFPWVGAVRDSMRRLLADGNVKKIACNMDMEDRWARKHLGVEVRGWAHDTMLVAHMIDPRGDTDRKSNNGITGLKFQSFVRLGQPPYNEHVEPYLASDKKGGYALNRVKQIKQRQLLLYNGMDALLEYEVAKHQAAELGLELE